MAQPQSDLPSSTLLLDPSVGDCINPEQIRFWIQDCEENHGARCNDTDHQSETPLTKLRLIDVIDLCVVSAPPQIRYFALSYVSGGAQQMQLTIENCLGLSKSRSLQQCWDKIPVTIQDAIHCTAALQERYLWVDSLCILQNDSAMKHDQISHAGSIFNGAVACLVAVEGVNANSGLSGVRAHTRTPERRKLQYEDLYLVDPGPDEYTSLRRPRDNSPYIKLERRLRLRQLDLSDRLAKSLYNSRAWAYQERLLSRRCIYFMDNMVYFHCRSAIRAENKTTPYSQWIQDIRQLSLFKADPIFSGDPLHYSKTLGALYAGLVTEYTCKHLTLPEDILKAFSGIGGSMEKICGWRFIAGMPETLLEHAWLWYHTDGPNQRRRGNSGGMFPSWSWAGWSTAVRYDTIYRTEPSHEPFLADMNSLICELHMYDGKTARFIQNTAATTLQLTMGKNKPPPTDVPQWLDRFSNMQISRSVLIFQARTWPMSPFRKLFGSDAYLKSKISIADSRVYNEIERLSSAQFPDLPLEVIVLSLVKQAGREHENWYEGVYWVNFMVIQWDGDFAERKFVGKLLGTIDERRGRDDISILIATHDLLRDVNCGWKTIRLI